MSACDCRAEPAGSVDVIGFLWHGVFVAQITGNLIRLYQFGRGPAGGRQDSLTATPAKTGPITHPTGSGAPRLGPESPIRPKRPLTRPPPPPACANILVETARQSGPLSADEARWGDLEVGRGVHIQSPRRAGRIGCLAGLRTRGESRAIMASRTGNARDPMPAAAYGATPPATPAANPVMAGQVWGARLRAVPADGGRLRGASRSGHA
jgi:hypothetical protein